MSQKLLAIVDIQLIQAKKEADIDTIVYGGLAIIILMRDFYQFLPQIEKPLWKKAIIIDKLYGKTIWNHFTSIITLTQQIK